MATRSSDLLSIDSFRHAAKRAVPRQVFDYLDGGAEDEKCLYSNLRGFDRYSLLPRVFRKTEAATTSCRILGESFAAPMIVGPTGLNGLIRPDGDILMAQAALKAGVPFVVSTASSSTLEAIAGSVQGPLWFQLYTLTAELTRDLVDRAMRADYSTLLITADCVIGGKREREIKHNFQIPPGKTLCSLRNWISHPRWTYRNAVSESVTLANLQTSSVEFSTLRTSLGQRKMDRNFTWDSLQGIRDKWPRKLIVKGLLHPADVVRCQSMGVDAVVLSNHGGRQLDCVPTALEILGQMVEPPDINRFIDGGIRRGSDVIKALALGASAVLLGRAPLYGLATDGLDGAYRAIETIKSEMLQVLTLLGCEECSQINRDLIQIA